MKSAAAPAGCGQPMDGLGVVGKPVEKNFKGHGKFSGTVLAFHARTPPLQKVDLWTVRYEDGDEEDYVWHELRLLLKAHEQEAPEVDGGGEMARQGRVSAAPNPHLPARPRHIRFSAAASPSPPSPAVLTAAAQDVRAQPVESPPVAERNLPRKRASHNQSHNDSLMQAEKTLVEEKGAPPAKKRAAAAASVRMEGGNEGIVGLEVAANLKANTVVGQGRQAAKLTGEGGKSEKVEMEEEEEMTEYEQQRQANIRRNKDILAGATSQQSQNSQYSAFLYIY